MDGQISGQNSQRNYGIDLLRILSMFMVVMLHMLGHGGVYDNCEPFSASYYTAWFLVAAAKCAVNVFAMISGYVMVGKRVRAFRIIPLWLLVFFYSTLGCLLFKFVPALSAIYSPSLKEMVKLIFLPTMTREYWYWTCYFCIFFFIPFFNEYIASIDQKTFRRLLLAIIILFSLLPPFTTLFRTDSFNLERGYSPLWLACLYFFGAYLKLYPPKISKAKAFGIYFLCVFCAWFAKFVSHFALKAIAAGGKTLGAVAGIAANKDGELDLFIDYTSIFVIISAAALLVLFSQVSVKNSAAQKIIYHAARLAFSVFIIHCQAFFYGAFFCGRFSFIGKAEPPMIVAWTILCSAGVFALCEFIDLFRALLFKLLKVEKIPLWLESIYDKRTQKPA